MSGPAKKPRLPSAQQQPRQFISPSTKKTEPAIYPKTTRPSVNSHHLSDRLFEDANISAESRAAIKHKFMSDVQAATLDVSFLFSSVALCSHTDECSPVSPIWQRSVGSSKNWDRQDHSVPPSRNRTSSQPTSAGHLDPRPRPNT